MTLMNSYRWPRPLRDSAWHGPEAYLVGDWETLLTELGVRAATFEVEENDCPGSLMPFLIESLGGHEHEFVLTCVVCWRGVTE